MVVPKKLALENDYHPDDFLWRIGTTDDKVNAPASKQETW
jgi:hypothetical protein